VQSRGHDDAGNPPAGAARWEPITRKDKEGMKQIINRIEYDTEKAELLASNRYWDGSNWERSGRNTYLYRTAKGRYFAHHTTQWQGERSSIEPLGKNQAMELYETLPETEVEYSEAFGEKPEEA